MTTKNRGILNSFENFVKHLPGFENLDTLLSDIPEGRRADYAFLGGRILIEQKYKNGPSARRKRESVEAMFEKLTGEPHCDIGQILERMPSLKPDIYQELVAAVNMKTNFVQDMFSDADKQIGNTINLLKLGWAHGLLAILNDHVNGEVDPREIYWRADRELKSKKEDGSRRYGNVLSVFVLSHHLQTRSLFTNYLDISHREVEGRLVELNPVAERMCDMYNSAIPNRTGPVTGKIPSSVFWPLTDVTGR